jgi:hypothetical protein
MLIREHLLDVLPLPKYHNIMTSCHLHAFLKVRFVIAQPLAVGKKITLYWQLTQDV